MRLFEYFVFAAMLKTLKFLESADAAPLSGLRAAPNYDKIIHSFSNTSEPGLHNIRAKLQSLNAEIAEDVPKIQNSPPLKVGGTTDKPTNETIADGPMSIAEINQPISAVLYQSDLLLTPEQLNELTSSSRSKRKAIIDPVNSYKWPTKANGVIPYFLHVSLTPEKISIIKAAVKFWEENTCVKFQLNATGNNSILFYNGDGCYSYIGMVGRLQDLSIGDGCEYFGHVTHEIAHALGFWHEQSRYDRDNYVEIDMSNVIAGEEHNFVRRAPTEIDLHNIPYDFGSIMHYESDAFAIDPSIPVITAKDKHYQDTIGQRRGPSFLDVLTMNLHYGCNDICASSTIDCKNGGYPDPNNCNQCKCPLSFGGVLCDSLDSPKDGVCGGSLTATTKWQSLAGITGPPGTMDNPNTCYWHLKSPEGTKMEVKLAITRGACNTNCFWNSVGIVLDGDYRNSGVYHCCTGNYTRDTSYVSSTNLVPVIAFGSNIFPIEFTIQFRYVPQSVTEAPITSMTPSPIPTVASTTTSTEQPQ